MSAVDYVAYAKAIYLLLRQEEKWVDRRGAWHDIAEMSVRYKRNVIGFLERRAAHLARAYEFGQLEVTFAPIGREVTHVDALSGEHHFGDVIFGGPRGQMATDMFERGLEEQEKQIDADPVGWLRTTPLLRRLISEVANDIGGTDGDDEHRRWLASREACDDHEVYDPECGACIEANSDAPEWTLS